MSALEEVKAAIEAAKKEIIEHIDKQLVALAKSTDKKDFLDRLFDDEE